MLAKESAVPIFDLPNELLEVLPLDPFEQLDVARKITSIALSTRVSALESEASVLRHTLTDRDNVIADVQAQIQSLDASLSETADKLAQADREKVWSNSTWFTHRFSRYLYVDCVVSVCVCGCRRA